MKNLRVGMRVRILWSLSWPELAGKLGVIKGIGSGIIHESGIKTEWLVAPDEWGSHMSPNPGLAGGDMFSPSSEQLEPLYDGNETVTWESCAWKPEGVTT